MKKIYKEILNELTNDWEMTIQEVPYTDEELSKQNVEALKVEYANCVSLLASTDWIYTKQRDLGLSDIELYEKHTSIIDSRVIARSRMQELQLLLQELGD